MELKIRIEKPKWDPNPEKSRTDNHSWRRCVIVEFPNCISRVTGYPFKWIPTYGQLLDIYKLLKECEQINSVLAKEHFKR